MLGLAPVTQHRHPALFYPHLVCSSPLNIFTQSLPSTRTSKTYFSFRFPSRFILGGVKTVSLPDDSFRGLSTIPHEQIFIGVLFDNDDNLDDYSY